MVGIEMVSGWAGSKDDMYWVVGAPADFRCGAERLLVRVRETLGRSLSMAVRSCSATGARTGSRC